MYIMSSMYMPMYVPSLNKGFIIIIIIIIIIITTILYANIQLSILRILQHGTLGRVPFQFRL